MTTRARALTNNPTDAERALWRHLRKRQIAGYRFRRQHPIGPYIVDFFCFEKNLCIEIDGGNHSKNRDNSRTAWLQDHGYRVIRFWNNEVLSQREAVTQAVLNALTGEEPPS